MDEFLTTPKDELCSIAWFLIFTSLVLWSIAEILREGLRSRIIPAAWTLAAMAYAAEYAFNR